MSEWFKENLLTLISIAVVLVGVSVVFCLAKRQKDSSKATTKELTFGAACIAAAFALSFFGYGLPQGGTITPASVLPIMLYCHYFGIRKGSVVCIAFTLLQFMQNPYIMTPFQVILDYFVPYLALIFTGCFTFDRKKYACLMKENKPLIGSHVGLFIGGALYAVVRYASHVLSGAIFFGEYAWAGWGKWPYSLVYNSFSLADAAIALAVGFALLSNKAFNAFMAKTFNGQQNTDRTEKND